ncbi:uncharacterized protein CBL_03736 [Carabus blaptoides fortunei]
MKSKNNFHNMEMLCFREFVDYDWQGYYVKLELAKESFLERLKREREEAQGKTEQNSVPTPKLDPPSTPVQNNVKKKVYHSSSSESESSSSEDEEPKRVEQPKKVVATKKDETSSSESDSSDSDEEVKEKVKKQKVNVDKVAEDDDGVKLVIKNNKNRASLNGVLKIESVNATPIHIIGPKNSKVEKKDAKSLEADEKRRKSLKQMKNSYNQQKSAIKNALSAIDIKPKNKIIFNDNDNYQENNYKRKRNDTYDDDEQWNNRKKKSLFDEDADDGEQINFEIKKQFEGKEGQKLLELQSRFTNDKRFTMDSRFYHEADDGDQEENVPDGDDEKQKQLDILESVLGQKFKKISKDDSDKNKKTPKGMLRFDPSKPEHSKFEIKEIDVKEKSKMKEKAVGKELAEETNNEEPQVEVSKETFYKVTANLKQSLQQNEGFSLLNMFGTAEEKDETEGMEEQLEKKIMKSKDFDTGQNPFKYDSSDTEDEDEPTKKQTTQTKSDQKQEIAPKMWRENFFFKQNDERLKDGLEFLKKLGCELKTQSFSETRKELKQIIRHKVRNNISKNRPFKKKLGRHKMIKVKKAIRK